MKRKLKAGSTSITVVVFIPDTSSTTGAGLTGLTNASAGLTCYYRREGANASVAVTLAAGTLGTWSSGGFKELDATNMRGQYELGIPDAALATGAKYVTLSLRGAANMPEVPVEIELDAVDYQDAAAFGLSRIDAAVTSRLAPTTAGRTLDVAATGEAGLDFDNIHDAAAGHTLTNITVPTATAVTNDVGITQAAADKAWSTATRALTDKAGFALSAAGVQAIWDALTSALTTVASIGKLLVDNINATISSRMASGNVTVGAYAAGQDPATLVLDVAGSSHNTAGTIGAEIGAAGSAGDPWSTALPGAYAAGTAGKIVGTNLDATVSSRSTLGGTAQTGDNFARLGAPAGASVSADVAAVNAKTTNLPASPAAVGSAMALTSGERDSVADALLDRTAGVEVGLTPRQAMRLMAAALAGKVSGAATTTVIFRNAVADSKPRITSTCDAAGNRTVIVTDTT